MSESELSRRSKVPQPTINRILSGESSSPRRPTIDPLAKALGIPPDWLMFGGADDESGSPSSEDYALIPQVTARGSSGSGYLNDHIEVCGELAFKKDWLARMGLKENNLSVMYNSGESNWPTLSDGEVLLVDKAQTSPKDGKMYAMSNADGEIIIKRLIRDLMGGWLIRSDSQDKTRYPDMPVSDEALRTLEIFGRVVWRGGII